MSILVMKCALQSLESVEKVNGWDKDSIVGRHCTQSAHFLRQAIAEAEDAVAAEREACAQACEDLIGTRAMARHCADSIRARSEK